MFVPSPKGSSPREAPRTHGVRHGVKPPGPGRRPVLLIVSLCPVLESGRLCVGCIAALWGRRVLLHVSSPAVNPECRAGKVQLFKEGERKKTRSGT